MVFISPLEIEELKNKLVSDPSQLGKLYKAKKNAYLTKNVEHSLVEGELKGGWEEYGVPLKTKTKLRKLKTHDTKFEDDLWCQLYDLGYRHLNFGRDFKLFFGKDTKNKKQIDVIAVNDDTVLLVECKSSKKPSRAPSFREQFDTLPTKLGGFTKTLEQMFGKGKRVKYIFATRNLKLDRDSDDIERLTEAGGYFYNDNTFDYVSELLKKYKSAAHYQFLALLFKGQLISKDKVEVPAIEGTMGGKTYYMFSIEPHLLLKMGFILHRTRANEAEMPTYQRLLVPSRLKGITKFIGDGGYFPNSVILNFSNTKNSLQFEASAREGSSRSRSGVLKIPNAYAIAYIIDGQHRVYGYANTPYKDSNTIPVVAFTDLDPTEQLSIFMDVNENQKAVSATLRITLEEDLYWNSERADSRMKALRSSIIRELGGTISSPIYNKISIGEDKAELSANPFATALSKSGLLPNAKGNQFIGNVANHSLYNISNLNHNKEMSRAKKSIVSFLSFSYQYVEENFSEIFNKDRYFIVSNRGTFAFISLVGSLNAHESGLGNVSVKTSPKDRFEAINKYLTVFLKELESIDKDTEDRLLSMLGSGSEIAWFRFFQEQVNKHFSNYEPADLLDWKERQDQELQDAGRKLGTETEKYIKSKVIGNLKILFGSNWDIEIGTIKRSCEDRAGKEEEKLYKEGLGRKHIKWTEMFFISDYKTILEKYWATKPKKENAGFQPFSDLFSLDVGHGFNSKSEKLKWLSIFNSHRNNWAHEGTKEKGLNREEVEFLKFVHEALIE